MADFSDIMPSLPLDLALECLHRVPLQGHSTLRQVCTAWRAVASSPSFCEARQSKGYTDNRACIIQAQEAASSPGKSPAYALSLSDAKLQSWSSLPPIPDFPNGLPLFCSCIAAGSRIVLLGGWDPSSWSVLSSVYIFHFSRFEWCRGAPMPTARSFFAAACTASNRIVVAGGHDDNKKALRSVEMYDVDNDVWERLPDMSQERDECQAFFLDGKVLVVSGFSTECQGQFLQSAESFDFVERRWATVDNFWLAGGRAPSSLVAFQDQLYAFVDGHLVRRKALDNSWEPVLALPRGVKALACATPVRDGVFVVGLSEAAQPSSAFVCRIGTGTSTPTWQKLHDNTTCCGIVQHTACTIEV